MKRVPLFFAMFVAVGLASCDKPEVTKPDTNKECLNYNGRVGNVESVALVGTGLYKVGYRTADDRHELVMAHVYAYRIVIDLPDGQTSWVEQRSGSLVQREVSIGSRGKEKVWYCLIHTYVHLSRNQKIVDQRQDDSSNGLNDLLWLIPVITSS